MIFGVKIEGVKKNNSIPWHAAGCYARKFVKYRKESAQGSTEVVIDED